MEKKQNLKIGDAVVISEGKNMGFTGRVCGTEYGFLTNGIKKVSTNLVYVRDSMGNETKVPERVLKKIMHIDAKSKADELFDRLTSIEEKLNKLMEEKNVKSRKKGINRKSIRRKENT